VQLGGALLVLAGFAGSQLGWFGVKSLRYLVVNAVGSGILATIAILEREWGFILLESAWTIVSIAGLVALLTRHRSVA
ncbi:MAG TPA: hypothetical protein VFP05_04175, partial [Thermomicrobiales bacterium]|nr:hypothetical protein [Thermomicrobiales bacterium]